HRDIHSFPTRRSSDLIETCASAAQHGAKYLLILNWHELNVSPLGVAAETLHREHGMTVLTVQACFVAEELFGKECNGLTHGGEIDRKSTRLNSSHDQI